MKILITGSEGVLGTVLKKELRQRGHDVYGCDLKHCHDPQIIRADIAEYRQLERTFDFAKPELVYHLAAEFGRMNGQEYYEQLWKTNCIGTRNVIEQCLKHDSILAFASSSEAYGDADRYAPKNVPFLESWAEEYAPYFHNEYALTKWTNERQIFIAEQNQGLKATIFRFFNAYGPGEYYNPYRSVVCLFIYRLLTNQPITVYKNYYRVFMWVGDWVKTVANYADNTPIGGIYNIGGQEYISVEELKDRLLALIPQTKSEIHYMDSEKANVISKKPYITSAQIVLGHDPKTTLNDGLPLTVEWMRQVYGL